MLPIGTIVVITPGPKPEEGYIKELGDAFHDIPLREQRYLSRGENVWIWAEKVQPDLKAAMVLVEVTDVTFDHPDSEIHWRCNYKTGVITFGSGFGADIFKTNDREISALQVKYPDRFSQGVIDPIGPIQLPEGDGIDDDLDPSHHGPNHCP